MLAPNAERSANRAHSLPLYGARSFGRGTILIQKNHLPSPACTYVLRNTPLAASSSLSWLYKLAAGAERRSPNAAATKKNMTIARFRCEAKSSMQATFERSRRKKFRAREKEQMASKRHS